MDNIITIRLKEKEDGTHDYKIEFESCPHITELIAAWMILKEVTENNFARESIYKVIADVYPKIRDIEEVQ